MWRYEPKESHGRIASPPQMFPCIFDLSTKNEDLATHIAIMDIEKGEIYDLSEYMDSNSPKYRMIVDKIRERIGFTTLKYQTIDDMIKAVVEDVSNSNLRKEELCLHCWIGNNKLSQ